ncbi:MAG TPA: FkbM family methyltransferase, partial [Tepidisphaeraceae bacterium]|nr:FkbM family methyltransferase [Tepidisphaeraceae bacterium]
VKVMAMALSDHDGSESLQIDDVMGGTAVLDSVSHGEASASRQRLGLKPKTETVSIRTLDRLIDEAKLPKPDVMKIDTEGAEAIVLKGAEGVLKNKRPRLLIALHGEQPARATLELLHKHGYICYGTTSKGPETRPLTLADAVSLQDNNIIALPG